MYDRRRAVVTSKGYGHYVALTGGLVLVALVGFFFGFRGPEMLSGSPSTVPVTQADTLQGTGYLADVDLSRFEGAYKRFDPQGLSDWKAMLVRAKTEGWSDTRLFETSNEILMDSMADSFHLLAQADTRFMDEVLVMSRDGLDKASRANDPLCHGAQYSELWAASQSNSEAVIAQTATKFVSLFLENKALTHWMMDSNAVLMNAMVDAKKNPKSYGAPGQQDRSALMALALPLMSNPDVLALMNSDKPVEVTLRDINICSLGSAVSSALLDLPSRTKGRLLSGMKDQDLRAYAGG